MAKTIFDNWDKNVWHDSSIENIVIEYNNVIVELGTDIGIKKIVLMNFIPIAETDYEDYICLYYRENAKNPSIIYGDNELAFENETEGISFLYGSIHEFVMNLMPVQ